MSAVEWLLFAVLATPLAIVMAAPFTRYLQGD